MHACMYACKGGTSVPILRVLTLSHQEVSAASRLGVGRSGRSLQDERLREGLRMVRMRKQVRNRPGSCITM